MSEAIVDRWLGFIFILGGLAWSLAVRSTLTGHYEPAITGPPFFPLLMGLLLALLGLVLVIKSFLSGKKHQTGHAAKIMMPDRHEFRVVISTFFLLIVYGYLLERIGFLGSTPIVIVAVFLGILGITSWRMIVSMALGLTFGCYILFVKIIGTYLPQGTWWQVFNF